MERTKNIIITGILMLFITISVYPINKAAMLNAYLSGDMHYWQKQIDLSKLKTNLTSEESMVLLNYEYGYIGYLLGIKSHKQASYYLKDASARLKNLKSLQRDVDRGQLEALSAAFTGYQIGLAPWKAPLLGPESINYAEMSIAQQADAPWGFIQMGNIKRYSPGVFGGSKEKALNYYLKAKQLFETIPEYSKDWQYISLLVSIAQTYAETDDSGQAEIYYAYIKSAYPTLKWIKEIESSK